MSERTVKVAYVTKWAGSIAVWRGAKTDGHFLTHEAGLMRGGMVNKDHWTEDRTEAERRWRENRSKEIKAAERKLNAAAKALRDGPTWDDATECRCMLGGEA